MPLVSPTTGTRPILAVHGSRKTQRILARVLSATLRPVVLVGDVEAARAELGQTPELLVIERNLLLDGGAAFLDEAGAAGATSCIVLVGSDDVHLDIPGVFEGVALSNFIASEMPELAEELVVTALKLLRRDAFGMEKYLSWGFVPVVHRLDRAGERTEAVSGLREHIAALGLGDRLASVAGQVADELLSNAIFHAPVDDEGVHVRSELARSTEFQLGERDRVQLRYGCDGRYFCIEVTDHWGSIDRDTFVRAVGRRMQVKLTPKEAASGAGIGLAMVYANVAHLVCNLAPGERTEMIGLFDVRQPLTSPGDRLSSFNVFLAHPGESAP